LRSDACAWGRPDCFGRTSATTSADESAAEQKKVAPAQPGPRGRRAWIEFKVLHARTGKPIPGILLTVRLPGGEDYAIQSDAGGMISLDDIDPGTCDLTCDLNGARLDQTLKFVSIGSTGAGREPAMSKGAEPLIIAHVKRHKVAGGESLDSLARQAGITAQELARFNWNTDDPERINEFLKESVGCPRMSPDGSSYVFDSSDTPGILYIPTVWEQKGFATGKLHYVRVETLHRIWIRMEIDPRARNQWEDQFKLWAPGGAYESVKRAKDDMIRDNQTIDLLYEEINPELRYSLTVTPKQGKPYTLFSNRSFAELRGTPR
jgi:hypothetical protein